MSKRKKVREIEENKPPLITANEEKFHFRQSTLKEEEEGKKAFLYISHEYLNIT